MRKLQLLAMMLVLIPALAFSQTRVITGRVTDDKGEPVAFATVKIKGTRTSLSADENGFFRIAVPGNATLEISAAGAETKEVSVSGQGDVINVSLVKTGTDLTAVTV